MTFPRLRLRDEVAALLDLPWELPLADWDDAATSSASCRSARRATSSGSSSPTGIVYALKELPAAVAEREFEVLRHLEEAGLPAVRAVGLAERSGARRRGPRDRVPAPLDAVPAPADALPRRSRRPYRDRLLDAMALLLVDLHRGGVYWGDCSLANTLFRRDGDRIQAYLVDAETSEVHPSLSDGQRRFDLDILVENVAFGLADLAAYQGRPDDIDAAIDAAECVRDRYEAVWGELYDQPDLIPGDRRAIRARLRRLNDLGFSVDLEVDPVGPAGSVRLRTSVTTRRYHANELERRTRLRTLEGQARILLNDLAEYHAWLEFYERRADRRPRRPPTAGCGRSTGRRSPGSRRSSGRTATWSRPTATSSSTSGCSRSGPGATWASGGDRVVRRRGRAGPGADRRRARPPRRARRGGGRPGLGGRRRASRPGVTPGRGSAAPALPVDDLVLRPPAAGRAAGAVSSAGSAG